MRLAFQSGQRDLSAAVALAILGLLGALVPAPEWIRLMLLAPLVLVLPGYAACAALFPPGAIPPAERTVYTVALSAALSTLVGIVVQSAIPLDRAIWAVSLTAVTAGAATVARRSRARSSDGEPRRAGSMPALPGALSLGGFAIAFAVGAWAISISVEGARENREAARFTELWALPERAGEPGAATSVAVGVANEQGRPVSYRVRASRADTVLRQWTIRLADGESWRGSLRAPAPSATEPLRVAVLRGDRVVRRVLLRSGLSS